MLREWAGWGSPLHSCAPSGLDLGPCCRASLTALLLPASWKTGPWTPCSASCEGGSQSRTVYCVSSDGAGVQEAAEDAKCAALPEKPPTTQACNLQRCTAWSAEPWGEVRPGPDQEGRKSGAGSWAWAAAGQGWEARPPPRADRSWE